MQLGTSYKQILTISLPIMLGSAAQNIITLGDSILLYYYSEVEKLSHGEFASVGFVGVFYLVVTAIGFGFSRGAQIQLARKAGASYYRAVGKCFWTSIYFQLFLASLAFLFLHFATPLLFRYIVDSKLVMRQSLEYIEVRKWGVFCSYIGMSMIAYYSGIARTRIIIYNTALLGIVNLVLDYGLVFGAWGLPQMGIKGAALASNLAEITALSLFLIYIFFDKYSKKFLLSQTYNISLPLMKEQYHIGFPLALQMMIGMSSFVFLFSIIENLGERALAVSNLVRIVFLILSVPIWGLSSGVNTLVSNFIGQKKWDWIIPITFKTAVLCFIITVLPTVLIAAFPEIILKPVFQAEENSLINDAKPILWVLVGVMSIYTIGATYFNGLLGTGKTLLGLKIQAFWVIFYIIFAYSVVNFWGWGLKMAWATEGFYWLGMWAMAYYFLKRNRKKAIK